MTILASPGDIRVRVSAHGNEEERGRRLGEMTRRVRELVGEAAYGTGRASLEAVVGERLRGLGLTLAVAESCTGGLLAARLTGVAGSSDYFVGGGVTYSNTLKREVLGVPQALLVEHGAVSEAVARSMAEGAVRAFGSDLGIGITGIAGPGGGSDDKPLGLVHLAIAGGSGRTEHLERRILGGRKRVRRMATQWALELLRRRLKTEPAAGPLADTSAPAAGEPRAPRESQR